MKGYDMCGKGNRIAVFASAILLLTISGCIKEDRTGCPCRLVLDFSDVDTSVIRSADLRLASGIGYEFVDNILSSSFEDYMVNVPRTELEVCIWSGAGYCLNGDMSVSIPYGEESPPVFLHLSEADSNYELKREKVVLRKNHCVLTLQVEKGGDYPYRLTVKGKIDGYGADCRPSVGEFMCKAVPDTSGLCSVILPRQLDSSLTLEIDDGTDTVKTFLIGEYIIDGGYDWNAPDLDDIMLTVDYSLSAIAVKVLEWDSVNIYEVTI